MILVVAGVEPILFACFLHEKSAINELFPCYIDFYYCICRNM